MNVICKLPFYLCFIVAQPLFGQDAVGDSIGQLILRSPAFSGFKDNYMLVGSTLTDKPDESNSNIKFQISIKQRLTNAVLPFKTYAVFTYTQKSIWRIFLESSPFAESNYNPTLGIGKVFTKAGQLRGFGFLMFEHESNGRDSIFSRSWNRISGTVTMPISRKSMLTLRAWIPFSHKADNPGLIDYLGYGEATLNYLSPERRWLFDLTGRFRSVEAQLSYRFSKNANQYIGLQWFSGYGETLIDYQQVVHMVRVGLMIKPNLMSSN